jgi:hypothetical protein
MNSDAVDKLMELGLAEYEAKAYLALLRESPITGHKLAELSGVPRSAIYEALLEGAVAVLGEWPPEELPESLSWGTFPYVRVLDATRAWFWLCEKWGRLCEIGAVPARWQNSTAFIQK